MHCLNWAVFEQAATEKQIISCTFGPDAFIIPHSYPTKQYKKYMEF